MNPYNPGALRQKLQDKIKSNDESPVTPVDISTPEPPLQIKNTDPAKFAQTASTYAASEMKAIQESVSSPMGTAAPPSGSVIHTPVHERMKSFVKDQYGVK